MKNKLFSKIWILCGLNIGQYNMLKLEDPSDEFIELPNGGLVASGRVIGNSKYDWLVPYLKVPDCENGYWTKWYDRDDPDGNGDHEILSMIQEENSLENESICNKPVAIDARIKSNRYPYQMSGNYVQISPSYGLQCWNKLQMNQKKCQDFEIRFCCRFEQFPCDGAWTQWFNRDTPSGVGDVETLDLIRHQYPDVCQLPTAIGAKTIDNQPIQRNLRVHTTPEFGILCLNAENPIDKCPDLKVKFCCPELAEPLSILMPYEPTMVSETHALEQWILSRADQHTRKNIKLMLFRGPQTDQFQFKNFYDLRIGLEVIRRKLIMSKPENCMFDIRGLNINNAIIITDRDIQLEASNFQKVKIIQTGRSSCSSLSKCETTEPIAQVKAELTQELEGLKLNHQSDSDSKSLFNTGPSFKIDDHKSYLICDLYGHKLW